MESHDEKANQTSRFHIEKLDQRIAPGAIVVDPLGAADMREVELARVAAPIPGIVNAHGRSGGVVDWMPG
jgi:hypothetical protein